MIDNAFALGNEALVAATILAPMAVVGVAIGIGRIGEATMTALSKARDGEVRQQIRENMMIPVAMIEGTCMFCAVIAVIMAFGGLELIKVGSGS